MAILVVAQIASTAATARLIAPSEFGLYAVGQAAAAFAGYFSLAAVGPGLQRRASVDRAFVGTALALSLSGGLSVALILWFGASVWADAWGLSDASSVIKIFALSTVLNTLAAVPIGLLRRALEFKRAAMIETGAIVLGLTIGVGLAVALESAVALALGQVAAALSLLLSAGWSMRKQLAFSFDVAAARELATFATQVGGLGFFTFVTITMPSWFVARIYGSAVLGLYSRANMIVALPADYATVGITKVVFPLYGKVQGDIRRTRSLLAESITLSSGLVWVFFGAVAGAAPVIVDVLLGPQWQSADSLLPLFALAACGYTSTWLLTNAAEALNWMGIVARRQLIFFVGTLAVLLAGYFADASLEALLVGLAVAQLITYIMTLGQFVARGLLSSRLLLRDHLVNAATALVTFAVILTCVQVTESAPISVRVLSLLPVVAGLMLLAYLVGGHLPAGRVLHRRLAHMKAAAP